MHDTKVNKAVDDGRGESVIIYATQHNNATNELRSTERPCRSYYF